MISRFFYGAACFYTLAVFFATVPVFGSVDTPDSRDRRIEVEGPSHPLGYYPGDPIPAKTIYLTFDDGPGDYTASILDILKEKGVKATFFINSFDRDADAAHIKSTNELLAHKDELRRMVREGHIIGNHTFSHRNLAALTPRGIRYQLDTLEKHLQEALGDLTPSVYLIRPPFGSPWLGSWGTPSEKTKVGSILAKRGILMMWTPSWDSGDSIDWVRGEWYKSIDYNPARSQYKAKIERMRKRILEAADSNKGGIILMHDTHPTSKDLLPTLIDELRAKGYTFDTLDNYCSWRWGSDALYAYLKENGILKQPAGTGPSGAGVASGSVPAGQVSSQNPQWRDPGPRPH